MGNSINTAVFSAGHLIFLLCLNLVDCLRTGLEQAGEQGDQRGAEDDNAAASHQLLHALGLSSLRIKKQGEVKNFCRSHPAGPRRIGLAQSSGKSTLPTKE